MNKDEFDFSGITKWHQNGYTGKGIRIANLEGTDPSLPFFHGKVKDPFGNATSIGRNYHGHQTTDILHQVAPDADIYSLPSGGIYSRDKAEGALIEISIPFMEQEGIHLVNASLGGTDNDILNKRIKQAQERGITFVTSAGNADERGASGYARSGVWIAVGAVHLSKNGEIINPGYSSVDDEVDFVQFSNLYVHDARKGYEDRTFPVCGTSFSSPMLCGMLALVQQYFLEKAGRTLKQYELYEFMQCNSIDLWEEGRDAKSGYGLFVLPDLGVDGLIPNLIPPKEVQPMFRDIDGHWAKNDIEKVAQERLLTGYPDGRFGPDEPVTRAQLAAVINRLIDKIKQEVK